LTEKNVQITPEAVKETYRIPTLSGSEFQTATQKAKQPDVELAMTRYEQQGGSW